jgi:hypothetical protein
VVVNDELALAFVRRYLRMVAELGPERAQPRAVFHGTSASNFESIIQGNLRVPDGATVLSASGRSTYGFGIYVSTSFELALMYGRRHTERPWQGRGGGGGSGGGRRERGAAGAAAEEEAAAVIDLPAAAARGEASEPEVVFVCLSLPGRQHVSAPPADTACRAVRAGFDSHVSADRGGQISVLFESAQILPCFLSTRESLICAQEASVRAVDVLLRITPRRGCASAGSADDAGSTTTATAEGAAGKAREAREPAEGEQSSAVQHADTRRLSPPAAGATTIGSAAAAARACEQPAAPQPQPHAREGAAVPETESVQRFGAGLEQQRPGRREQLTAGLRHCTGASEAYAAGGAPRASAEQPQPQPQPQPPQLLPGAGAEHSRRPVDAVRDFQTAEWDGVAKRMRYS